jgi:hypothetical protein
MAFSAECLWPVIIPNGLICLFKFIIYAGKKINEEKNITSAFSNLYTDQRIEKVCKTLYENGYDIDLIGNDWKERKKWNVLIHFQDRLKSKSLKTAYFEFNWKLYHN